MNEVTIDKVAPYEFNENDALWLSTPQFGSAGLQKFDVAYTGYTHIFVLGMPKFMEVAKPNLTKAFKILLERASTSFSGPANTTLETADVTNGIAASTIRVATKSTKDTTDITIRTLVMQGLQGRVFAKEYIRGISDPYTNIKTYLGVDPEVVPKSMVNQTFIILVVQSDESLEHVQDYGLYVNGTLTEHDRTHVNWDKGNISVIEGTDYRFTVTEAPETADVLELAKAKLANRRAIIVADSSLSTDHFDSSLLK